MAPRRRWWLMGAIVGVVIAVGVPLGLTQFRGQQAKSVVVRAPVRSIAVLPFVNLSGETDNEYFGDGLTEELINRVGRIPKLRVTGRTSAFAYKGRKEDVRAIGRDLGVATVLEGGVRRVGDRVRVNAQLIDARNGYQLWSDSYERDLSDIFTIHDEIAKRIAQVIGIQVGDADSRKPTTSVAAYESYLRGRTAFAQRASESDVRSAIAHFEQALAIDPAFAQAQASLAAALGVLHFYTGEPRGPEAERAAALARGALVIDPSISEAHSVLGGYYSEVSHEFSAAEEAHREAIRTGPNDVRAHHWYGDFLMQMGRLKDARRELAEAYRIDPAAPSAIVELAVVEMMLEHLDEAEQYLNEAQRLGRGDVHMTLGDIAVLRGDLELARREYDLHAKAGGVPSFADEILIPRQKWVEHVRVVRQECIAKQRRGCYWRLIDIHEYAGAIEAARRDFAHGFQPEAFWHPLVAKMRQLPEFKSLVTDLGLVAYWRKYGWADHCKPSGDQDFSCT
jgi:TolB-like protein/tetratricopeptide (TPR) repeat protein